MHQIYLKNILPNLNGKLPNPHMLWLTGHPVWLRRPPNVPWMWGVFQVFDMQEDLRFSISKICLKFEIRKQISQVYSISPTWRYSRFLNLMICLVFVKITQVFQCLDLMCLPWHLSTLGSPLREMISQPFREVTFSKITNHHIPEILRMQNKFGEKSIPGLYRLYVTKADFPGYFGRLHGFILF